MRSASSCKAAVAIKGDAGSLELSRHWTGPCPGAFYLSFPSVFLEGIDRRVENLSNPRTVPTLIIIVVMQVKGLIEMQAVEIRAVDYRH